MKPSTTASASEDAICLAYGRGVKELLSQSTASEWIEDLWIIYSGHMAFRDAIRGLGRFFCHFGNWCFSFRSWRLGGRRNGRPA